MCAFDDVCDDVGDDVCDDVCDDGATCASLFVLVRPPGVSNCRWPCNQRVCRGS